MSVLSNTSTRLLIVSVASYPGSFSYGLSIRPLLEGPVLRLHYSVGRGTNNLALIVPKVSLLIVL